jgi:hypothetical protein
VDPLPDKCNKLNVAQSSPTQSFGHAFAHLPTLGLITHCPLNKIYYEKSGLQINKKIKSQKFRKHKTLLMK